MDLLGGHLRMVLRNQIQNELFRITASGKQTSNPLLSDQGGFHLPSNGGLCSLPRTGGFGLSDGGYSKESKQVRKNLTGGLTEVPDRHAHTSKAGDGGGEQNDNSGAPDANALPAGNTSTIVAGQSRSLQQAIKQRALNSPLPPTKGAQAASTPRGATDLSDFINTNPGESFGKGKQTSYLIQKAGNSDIYFVYQKADLHKHYGSRSAYNKMGTGKLGESHAYKQVRVLSNGEKVVAYAKTSVWEELPIY